MKVVSGRGTSSRSILRASHRNTPMETASYFPDRQHVEQIRRGLWVERAVGQAAVMVGAGMSRNAEPARPGCGTMPTWENLITAMIDRLYPESSATLRRREKPLGQARASSIPRRLPAAL